MYRWKIIEKDCVKMFYFHKHAESPCIQALQTKFFLSRLFMNILKYFLYFHSYKIATIVKHTEIESKIVDWAKGNEELLLMAKNFSFIK